MTTEQLDRYREQLRAMADRLGRTAAQLEEQVRTPTGGEAGGGISNAPLHLGDMGTEVYNQELGATLLENESYIHDEVLVALGRIENGTFGKCENCDRHIFAERLEAVPYTRYCLPCAEKLGAGLAVNLNTGRPASWLGEPGHEGLSQTGSPQRVVGRDLGGAPDDVQAAGTPGGGTAVGGLAGTTVGGGDPDGANLERAMGDGRFDREDVATDDEDTPQAVAGPSGGAVSGTTADNRSRRPQSGRSVSDTSPAKKKPPAKKAPAPKTTRTKRTKK